MGTILAILALCLAAAAFVYTWLLRQDLDKATRRLDRYNRALYDASAQIRTLEEENAQKLAELRGLLARSAAQQSGRPAFVPDMTVREAYAVHPQARDVLAAYHMGGCTSCAIDAADRLDDLCRANGLEADRLLRDLNSLVATDTKPLEAPVEQNGRGLHPPGLVKLPNIELS